MPSTFDQADRFSLGRIFRFPADLVRNWFVISSLVQRELKGRYLTSAIGGVWAVVQPLFMLVVYTVVFAGIFQARWEAKGVEIPVSKMTYALMIYCAMIPWMAFQESLTRGAGIVLENSNLIKKVAFPSEALPLYVVTYTLVNELIGIAILLAALPFLGIPWTAMILWYPVVVAVRLVFTVGLVYLVSAANVFVRDVAQFLGIGLMLWMFLTPIFYSEKMIEDSDMAWVQTGMHLNPWYYIVKLYRGVFLTGQTPDPAVLGTILGIGLVTFVIGYAVFMMSKFKFSDEI